MPLTTPRFGECVSTLRQWGLPGSSIAYMVNVVHENRVYNWENGDIPPIDVIDRIKLAVRLGQAVHELVGSAYFPLFLYSNLAAVKYRMPVEVIRTSWKTETGELLQAVTDFSDTVKLVNPNPYPPRLREYNIKRLT